MKKTIRYKRKTKRKTKKKHHRKKKKKKKKNQKTKQKKKQKEETYNMKNGNHTQQSVFNNDETTNEQSLGRA